VDEQQQYTIKSATESAMSREKHPYGARDSTDPSWSYQNQAKKGVVATQMWLGTWIIEHGKVAIQLAKDNRQSFPKISHWFLKGR
jgi:hypothetical protein